MKANNLVSIIIPVYNVEKYLNECVYSVINQTYEEIEIILVDDGSTDGSGKMCDDFISLDNRILVIHKKNGGLSDARNEGVKKSHGRYICFIDSDDYVSPYFLEIMLRVWEENKCDFVMLNDCPSFWDGEDHIALAHDINHFTYEIVDSKTALKRMLLQNLATGAPFKLCPREYFDSISFPVGYLYEDAATTYKYFFKAKEVGIIYSNLYAYRMRKDSIIRQNFNEKKLIVRDIYEQLINDKNLIEWGLENEAHSRAFSLVFSVFLQVPSDDKKKLTELWRLIVKSRKRVFFNNDKFSRKKNKFAALVSCFGMNATHHIGKMIGQKGSMK